MSQLKKVTELKGIEERKEIFEQQLKALESVYFLNGTVEMRIETDDFKNKGTYDKVEFNKNIMKKYLISEIGALQRKSEEIIEELAVGLK